MCAPLHPPPDPPITLSIEDILRNEAPVRTAAPRARRPPLRRAHSPWRVEPAQEEAEISWYMYFGPEWVAVQEMPAMGESDARGTQIDEDAFVKGPLGSWAWILGPIGEWNRVLDGCVGGGLGVVWVVMGFANNWERNGLLIHPDAGADAKTSFSSRGMRARSRSGSASAFPRHLPHSHYTSPGSYTRHFPRLRYVVLRKLICPVVPVGRMND
ncbi:hypothetical protein BU23DRAFT_201563 [Bimuria novae-zelandiae CBS 107.79]|uniref:Uncharacterized protein n=1 Tax=Bimuria novae-zelandiae CBS 107.79 TaxID=1447943 RepID=A0A6A5V4B3_9PLEO|nr:hypothetical protein BU23DRAFT_201563 [Bimuria novae-zelandiae CBS 107.79]